MYSDKQRMDWWAAAYIVVFITIGILTGCCKSATNSEVSTHERIRLLIEHLGDKPDPEHPEITEAVHKICDEGTKAVDQLLQVMLDGDEMSRHRAQVAIKCIISNEMGFQPGIGWTDSNAFDEFRKLWSELGELDWESSYKCRLRSVCLWRIWLAKKH